ncbi:MAG: DUF2752 domain-containing protein [Spartobacteria bacterium]
MQVCRRSLAPRELDHELLWLLVSLGAFSLAALWFTARLPTPHCFFHSFTGLPCPTCGATRAAYQFLHGHFGAAFLFNPLAFLAYLALLVFDLYAVTVLATRAPRFRLKNLSPPEKLFWRVVTVVLLAGNWLYLVTSSALSLNP